MNLSCLFHPGFSLLTVLALATSVCVSQAQPALLVRFPCTNTDGLATLASDTSSGGANLTLNMLNNAGMAANFEGSPGGGVSGLGVALDFSTNGDFTINAAPSEEGANAGSGPIAENTGSTALNFGTLGAYTATIWFNANSQMPNSGGNDDLGPRIFILGPNGATDKAVANSVSIYWQQWNEVAATINTTEINAPTYATFVPTNQWLFFALTYNGTTATLWTGTAGSPAVAVTTETVSGGSITLNNAGGSVLMMGNRGNLGRPFDGWIDDFRFYSGAATSNQVEDIRWFAVVPANLVATAVNNAVHLTWSALGGALNYNVLRSTTNGGPYTLIASGVTSASYTDTTVANGTTYYYVVSAVDAYGDGNTTGYSQQAAAAPAAGPAVPGNFAATPENTEVLLTWNAPSGSPAAASYNISRSLIPGGETFYTNVTATTFADRSVTNGIEYFYTLAAVSAGGLAGNSATEANAIPFGPPLAPTGVVINHQTTNSIMLSWTDPNPSDIQSQDSYEIFSSVNGGSFNQIGTAGVGVTTYTDTTVTPGNTCAYEVVAVNDDEPSGPPSTLYTSPDSAVAQIYTPPANDRVDIILDSFGWKFIQQDVSGAQVTNFDDSSWTNVNLPHCWDISGGQSYPPSNYYQGASWYRVHFTPGGSYTNSHFFLKFDGAFLVTDVYLNGNFLGEHDGGFAAFVFDVTPYLNVGGDNVLAVRVDNAVNTNIPPLAADFTFWGGIYRDVHLLVTAPVQISPLDCGSPGVFLTPTDVSSNSANLQVMTIVSNSTATAQTVTVRAVVTDAFTNIVTTITNIVTIPAGSVSNVVGNTVIANPHLWNGLSDPYLYQTFVELSSGTNVVDLVAQPLGFRWFSVDPTNGFFLNGQPYDLHGVAMHQDWLNCGWALTNAQVATNFMFIKEIGATAVRLCHYEHDDYTYQLADQDGIILWSEIPLIDYITASPAFYANAEQQLRELIRQRYNHPSVICWGTFNEITLDSGPSPDDLVSNLVQVEAQEDTTRPSAGATLAGNGDATSWMPQHIAFNEYYGWYESPLNGIASWADNIHASHPTNCIGITEYGAGASIYQHSENPVAWPTTTGGLYHPEEWQNIVHETNWALMKARPFLWFKTAWNGFDFASDGRDEGDTPGRNDKGLVTYDRQTRKDAFYFYKANWTTNPMVYITGHTFTNRFTNVITAKVYANCDSVTFYLNGASQGAVVSSNCTYTWPATLQPGTNMAVAIGTKGSINVTDSLIWIAPISPPAVSILSPAGTIACLMSTNDTLLLSAGVSNPVPSSQLTTTWSQATGPGAVTFANSNGLTTTAAFSSNGLYGLDFTANNGAVTTVPITVNVGPIDTVTNGLLAWWKMNETNGTTAADSSGNGNTATVSGAFFTNYDSGYPSNALHFNGSSSYASFSSPGVTQLTLVAWARANAQGNSLYPRIFDTPGYRLFFRFDSQGSNGFDFATYSTDNGDWFSGQNTISIGAWYRVAASYDLSNLTNLPTEYVNGSQIASPTVISTPSGTEPSSAGTGYIGNVAALSRGWSGDLSDLRIYDRLLSAAEIEILASPSSLSYAPSVSAGSNQTVIWPGTANLSGTVADNGNPPGTVTTTWTETGGSQGVAFGNSNSISTSAHFPAPGTYQLQLAASDDQATTVGSLTVNAITPTLSCTLRPGAFQFSWPLNSSNWLLQYQSNPPSIGLGTNWIYIPTPVTNPFTTPIYPGPGSVFYRLVLTNQ